MTGTDEGGAPVAPLSPPAQDASPVPEEGEPKPTKRAHWPWGLIVLFALVILTILLALPWLRGCSAVRATRKTSAQTADQLSSPSTVSYGDLWAIENEVYAALRERMLPDNEPLTNVVYISRASIDGGVTINIKLTVPSSALVRAFGVGAPQRTAASCVNAALDAVAEVTRVAVFDADGHLISAAVRK